MLEQTIRFSSLLCLGAASGIALCVLLMERVGSDNGQFYTQLMQMLNRALTVPAPALGALGLVATVADAVLLYRRGAGIPLWLTAGAVLLAVVALVVTRFGHFPINDRVLGWDPANPPADWKVVQARWSALHVVRTSCASVSFALVVVGNLVRTSS